MMLLMGGTGLLGGQVLKHMRSARLPVRLYSRGSRDWRDSAVQDVRQKGVEFIIADALDKEKLSKAAEGCTAILNLVGSMPPKPGIDLEALHVRLAHNVLEIAAEQGIQRVIHVSCLGADHDAPGQYMRTKFQGEQIIRDAQLYWTIFRPSYIFADRFPLLDALMPLVKCKLFMPVIGSGQHEIQPVHADDVAACIVDSIYDKATVGKTFELAGKSTYSFQEIMEKARKQLGIPGVSMNIPTDTASKAADAISKYLPKAQINIELLQLMMVESTTEENALEDYFKKEPIPLESAFDKMIVAQ